MNDKLDPLSTICDLKWNYPIFNMDRGEFRSCCRTPAVKIDEANLVLNGSDTFLNSVEQKQSRLDLIQGKQHIDCQSCWNIEQAGMASPRHGPNQFWDHLRNRNFVDSTIKFSEDKLLNRLSEVSDITDPILSSYKPYMVEINLGSTCDMKCMYCSHHYSTQWAAERIKYKEINQDQYDIEFPKAPPSFDKNFWEWFNTVGRMNVSRLGIIGGEPLIMPEYYVFVDKLIESVSEIQHLRKNKITLWIVTNLNTPANYLEKFFKYLPKLTEVFNVEILVSMESVGARAEYIRNGVNWERFTLNLSKLLSKKELVFEFGFILSLNILNITSLKDFIMFTEQLYHTYGRPAALKQNIISFPDWQTPMLLTPDFADYLDECIAYMKIKAPDMPKVADKLARWDSYIIFLQNLSDSIRNNKTDNTVLRKKFAEWFSMYDDRRKLSFIETFPEYTNFFNLCKSL